ncbi:MAG: hypothetical protein R2849_13490 [Thermomicrobiales bacterium]
MPSASTSGRTMPGGNGNRKERIHSTNFEGDHSTWVASRMFDCEVEDTIHLFAVGNLFGHDRRRTGHADDNHEIILH